VSPCVRFVGYSGSGKTTVVSALIAHWAEAGFKVGAVKHASKAFQMDRPGKDSHRFRSSGAAAIAVASPTEFALISTTEQPATIADLVAHLPADLDVILVEGFKGDGGPAVEVHLGARELVAIERPGGLPGLFAVVTDRPGSHEIDVPQFAHDDIAALATFLEERLGIGAQFRGSRAGSASCAFTLC